MQDDRKTKLQSNPQLQNMLQEFCESIRDMVTGDVRIQIDLDVPFIEAQDGDLFASNSFIRDFKSQAPEQSSYLNYLKEAAAQ